MAGGQGQPGDGKAAKAEEAAGEEQGEGTRGVKKE